MKKLIFILSIFCAVGCNKKETARERWYRYSDSCYKYCMMYGYMGNDSLETQVKARYDYYDNLRAIAERDINTEYDSALEAQAKGRGIYPPKP